MHLRRFPGTSLLALGWLSLFVATPATTLAQDAADEVVVELSQEGSLVDFARDVQPILAAKCLECHGPEDAKNDFRVDDQETLLAYVEPEDIESSSLWADYLITDDPDMRMPPPNDDPTKALSGVELATIKLWIEEGAQWSEPPPVATVDVEPVAVTPPSTAYGLWIFQGLFHPATIHFPIALLTVSAGFVLLSFVRKETCEPVAFHCLWIGALGAIVACVSGWSYAGHEGYGMGFSLDLQNRAIDRHRWLGIAVAIVALILIPMASSVRRTGDSRLRFMWLLGSLLLVFGVSLVGYQGGELTFGEDHYWKEYERLFPQPAVEDLEEIDREEVDLEVIVTETEVAADQAEADRAGADQAPASEKGDASSATAEVHGDIESSSDAPPAGDPPATPEADTLPNEAPAEEDTSPAAEEAQSTSEGTSEATQEPASEESSPNKSD
jgi:uncharacterized membrane protein